MRNLLTLLLLVLVPVLFSSCRHGKIGKPGESGVAGQDGADGVDGANGADGIDGLNGLGFDYVRGIDGATVCNTVLIIPARHVVPSSILSLAPAEDPQDPDGLTLTFGAADSPIRFYLGSMLAGEYCVVEKIQGEGWVAIGDPLVFVEPGFVAVVPSAMIPLVDLSVVGFGAIAEFEGECNVLDYNRSHLRIGKDLRINFRRN